VGVRDSLQKFMCGGFKCFLPLVARKFIHLLARGLTYMVDQDPEFSLSITTSGFTSLVCGIVFYGGKTTR
jgi:hypothetical protein